MDPRIASSVNREEWTDYIDRSRDTFDGEPIASEACQHDHHEACDDYCCYCTCHELTGEQE